MPELAARPPSASRGQAAVLLAVFLTCALFAAVRSPVPGVNEPHYLTKAKHFWDPAWCAQDLFLNSANAHWFFYASIGWLTRWLSLAQTAWVGRIAGWLLLSAGWCALVRRLVPAAWGPLWALWLWLAACAVGSFSGEWVVGGIEGKVLAYACVFGALAAACASQWIRAGVWSGAAISFHPIVGGWSALALVGVAAWDVFFPLPPSRGEGRGGGGHERLSSRQLPFAAACGLLCALPGLIPAVQMLRSARPDLGAAADELQAFHRLAHHLDPERFAATAYLGYAALLVAWIVLSFVLPSAGQNRGPQELSSEVDDDATALAIARRRFTVYIAGALVIALAGLAIGWSFRNPSLMKFYPFRLADAFLPIAVAVSTIRWLSASPHTTGSRAWLAPAAGAVFALALQIPAADSNPTRMLPHHRADWTDACRWIDAHAPPDALCWSEYGTWGFRWYAQRAEYVSYKDCPQDAAGLVEWNRRLWVLYDWSTRHPQYTADALRALHQETGIEFILAGNTGPYLAEPVYENRSCRVYRIAPSH